MKNNTAQAKPKINRKNPYGEQPAKATASRKVAKPVAQEAAAAAAPEVVTIADRVVAATEGRSKEQEALQADLQADPVAALVLEAESRASAEADKLGLREELEAIQGKTGIKLAVLVGLLKGDRDALREGGLMSGDALNARGRVLFEKLKALKRR